MSKSTGNFLTIRDSIDKFGCDATRIALASAGDSLDDANFEEKEANSLILKLTTLLDWIFEPQEFRTGEFTRFDHIFINEMNFLI